jgi:hypothetical protein
MPLGLKKQGVFRGGNDICHLRGKMRSKGFLQRFLKIHTITNGYDIFFCQTSPIGDR